MIWFSNPTCSKFSNPPQTSARSCLLVRTQPLTATGAPSQTSTIPYHAIYHTIPCYLCMLPNIADRRRRWSTPPHPVLISFPSPLVSVEVLTTFLVGINVSAKLAHHCTTQHVHLFTRASKPNQKKKKKVERPYEDCGRGRSVQTTTISFMFLCTTMPSPHPAPLHAQRSETD